jgi:superfamily II DNA or RNA helicase
MNRELRYYQTDGINNLRCLMQQGHRRIVRQCPTGAGKSIEIVTIAESAASKGQRVCIMAHRQELLEQIGEKLDYPYGWIKAGKPIARSRNIQLASVSSMVNRLNHYFFDLIIADEAHHSVSKTWGSVINAYPKARVIGFTATPSRLDGKPLSDVFSAMTLGPSVQELIDAGYLKPAVYYGPNVEPDMTGVGKARGDFDNAKLASAMNKPTITGDAIEHYVKLAKGYPAVLFGVSINHIEDVAAQFRGAGLNFQAVHGKMDRKKVRGILADLGAGRIQGVTSCDLISEGVDIPVVSCGIFLRPTCSLGLWLQQLGRCLRPAENYPQAVMLDHAGNWKRHGLAHWDRLWTLDGKEAVDTTDAAIRIKKSVQCPMCGAIHTKAPECPTCFFRYKSAREYEQRAGSLSQITADTLPGIDKPLKPARLSESEISQRQREWDNLVDESESKGYKLGWAKVKFAETFGESPHVIDGRLVIPQLASKREVYKTLLHDAAIKGHKVGSASIKYKAIFGTWPAGFVNDVKRELGIPIKEWAGI